MAGELNLPEAGVSIDRLRLDLRQRDVYVPATVIRPVPARHKCQPVAVEVRIDLGPGDELREEDRGPVRAGDLYRDGRPLQHVGAEGRICANDLGAELIADLLRASVDEGAVELDRELVRGGPVTDADHVRRGRGGWCLGGCGGALAGARGHRLDRRLEGDRARGQDRGGPGERAGSGQQRLQRGKVATTPRGTTQGHQAFRKRTLPPSRYGAKP